MVAANAMWHAMFQHLLQHLLHLQSAGGCTIFMHLETKYVKCTLAGAKPEIYMVCVWGAYGSKRGTWKLVPIEVEIVCSRAPSV